MAIHPDSTFPLRRAVAALAASARQMGRPSALWIAGFGYQSLSLGWTLWAAVALPVIAKALPQLGGKRPFADLFALHSLLDPLVLFDRHPLLPVAWLPVILVCFRLVVGLAAVSPAATWREASGAGRAPRLRTVLRRGRGLVLPALGLWIQVVLLMFVAALVFVGPTQLLFDVLDSDLLVPLRVLVTGLMVALTLFYGFLLSIVFQLALHSMVQNRRGVGSALLHAWRVARNDPLATVRATLVDAMLYGATVAVYFATYMVVVVIAHLRAEALWALVVPFLFVVDALAGCTRCAYWARAYRALGGISTLETGPAAAEIG